jgi:hypothetical protein
LEHAVVVSDANVARTTAGQGEFADRFGFEAIARASEDRMEVMEQRGKDSVVGSRLFHRPLRRPALI